MSKSATVLVADDDPEILAMISRYLKTKDWRVVEAADGEEALSATRRDRPAVVILDVMMPARSGWEVCRAIREDSSLDATRVLMLTGIGERLNEMTSPLYGADDYLDKPFEFSDLDAKLQKLVALSEEKKGLN